MFDYEAENIPLSRETILAIPDGEKVYFEAAPHALGLVSGWRTIQTDRIVGKRVVSDDGFWSSPDGNLGKLFRVWPFRPFRDERAANPWPAII